MIGSTAVNIFLKLYLKKADELWVYFDWALESHETIQNLILIFFYFI